MFFRSDSQLVVEGVMPDFLHFVPVGNDTVFNRILKSENTTFGLGFVANVRVLPAHADHDPKSFS